MSEVSRLVDAFSGILALATLPLASRHQARQRRLKVADDLGWHVGASVMDSASDQSQWGFKSNMQPEKHH